MTFEGKFENKDTDINGQRRQQLTDLANQIKWPLHYYETTSPNFLEGQYPEMNEEVNRLYKPDPTNLEATLRSFANYKSASDGLLAAKLIRWGKENPYGKIKSKYGLAVEKYQLLRNSVQGKLKISDQEFKDAISFVKTEMLQFMDELQAVGPLEEAP